MNKIIVQIVNQYLWAYLGDHAYDPYAVWKYNNDKIIANIADDFGDEEYHLLRYVNNVIYWGQMELRNYV